MKINKAKLKKAILSYMTWGSPLQQVFVMDSMQRAGMDLLNKWDRRDNLTRMKAFLKDFDVQLAINAINTNADDVLQDLERTKALMKNGWVHPEAWIGAATHWREVLAEHSK